MMKKLILLAAAIGLLLIGCAEKSGDGKVPEAGSVDAGTSSAEQDVPALTVYPLADTTMESLNDAILSVSLEEGGAYVDDTGKMQMDLKIYSCDAYDMKDIAGLKVGDVLVTHAGQVEISALERNESGTVYINGGAENGGFNLLAAGGGIFYAGDHNGEKSWHEVGEATIRVSADFMGYDNADPALGEVVLYPGDFLIGAVENYDFTPRNTTVRVEGGQIVEMNRSYLL